MNVRSRNKFANRHNNLTDSNRKKEIYIPEFCNPLLQCSFEWGRRGEARFMGHATINRRRRGRRRIWLSTERILQQRQQQQQHYIDECLQLGGQKERQTDRQAGRARDDDERGEERDEGWTCCCVQLGCTSELVDIYIYTMRTRTQITTEATQRVHIKKKRARERT